MEKTNRFYQKNKDLRQNLAYKEYANGSVVEMAYVLTSAAGIRGKSTDELLFDEYQNFDPELEVEVSQTQSASEMPITIYAGTSLTTDSALEARWNESSQGSWVMKCAHCK
jgi:phage terminase large subunit GpA-like protein